MKSLLVGEADVYGYCLDVLEDYGPVRYLRLACARGPIGFFCCPCFFDCFCLLLLSLSFLPPLSPMVSPFGHYGLSPTTGLGAV